jgi:HAE1 family hydrophobic/amphiphilic exporter-1
MGLGDGGELQAPMARVVIGGLISATLITLVAIPIAWRAVHAVVKSAPVSTDQANLQTATQDRA